jgi:hypothetical protein
LIEANEPLPTLMPITIKQESDETEFGNDDSSYMVPMGYFSVIGANHETIKYLKSTGFASCIGLVLYKPESTVLAHFQSANWANSGVTDTAVAFGLAGVLDYAQYEGFVFLGSNVNGFAMEPQQEKSRENTIKGLKKVKRAMVQLGVLFPQNELDIGFKSVAVSLETGEVRLFEASPKAKKTVSLNLFPDVGAALTRSQPGVRS